MELSHEEGPNLCLQAANKNSTDSTFQVVKL